MLAKPADRSRGGRTPRGGRLVGVLVGLLLVTTGLAACSGDDDGDADGDTNEGSSAGSQTTVPLKLRTGVKRVAGDLPPARRKDLAVQLNKLVGRYLETAFLRPGSSSAQEQFPGFTPGARARAVKDRRLLTGAEFKDADRIVPVRAASYVAVAAPHGHPAGATAQVELDLRVTAGEETRPVHVRGRLLLTPTAKGWRIFGYDLSQSGGRA